MSRPRVELALGERYGRLRYMEELEPVVDPDGKPRRKALWLCDCGNTTQARVTNVRAGTTTSCGCYQRERTSATASQPRKHGLAAHPLYNTWCGMRFRCTNPRDNSFHRYGGRGISVYPEWLDSPAAFISYIETHLGPRPDGHSLDRIDNDGNYEPGNLRWATQREQHENQQHCRTCYCSAVR